MASITIRNLEESTKRKLRIRAAQNGRSMEQEAREILDAAPEAAAENEDRRGSCETDSCHMATVGGIELEALPREPMGEPDRLKDLK